MVYTLTPYSGKGNTIDNPSQYVSPIDKTSPGAYGWKTKNIPPVIDYDNTIQRQLEGLPGKRRKQDT